MTKSSYIAKEPSRRTDPSLPWIESTEEVEVDSNEPEHELPADTNESNSGLGPPCELYQFWSHTLLESKWLL